MKQSAGLLIYREQEGHIEVFLVHPGGPYWVNKDIAAWSIPKGEFTTGEDPLEAAIREFTEETGLALPLGKPAPLKPVRQPSGKIVHAWYLRGELQVSSLHSNEFEMEWPPKSGKTASFPEVDKAAWFPLGEAKVKLHKGQVPIVVQLERALGLASTGPGADGEQST